jgi:hypothetical protein
MGNCTPGFVENIFCEEHGRFFATPVSQWPSMAKRTPQHGNGIGRNGDIAG